MACNLFGWGFRYGYEHQGKYLVRGFVNDDEILLVHFGNRLRLCGERGAT
jgi:hypothetical protein